MINGTFIPMDQEFADAPDDNVTNIEVMAGDGNLLTVVAIRESCSLAELRQDIIDEGVLDTNSHFQFQLNGKLVLRRRENFLKCKDLSGAITLIYS